MSGLLRITPWSVSVVTPSSCIVSSHFAMVITKLLPYLSKGGHFKPAPFYIESTTIQCFLMTNALGRIPIIIHIELTLKRFICRKLHNQRWLVVKPVGECHGLIFSTTLVLTSQLKASATSTLPSEVGHSSMPTLK